MDSHRAARPRCAPGAPLARGPRQGRFSCAHRGLSKETMRRFFLTLLHLFALSSSGLHAQDANTDEPPVYLEFRVLSSLPWKEAGATRTQTLQRIFQEPNMRARVEVL